MSLQMPSTEKANENKDSAANEFPQPYPSPKEKLSKRKGEEINVVARSRNAIKAVTIQGRRSQSQRQSMRDSCAWIMNFRNASNIPKLYGKVLSHINH